jgi:hypothetical protein
MRTTLRIQARIRQPQSLNRTPMYEMLTNNLLNILRMDEPIPDLIGIDYEDRPMLALIEAPQLVSANLPLQTSFFHRLFES